MIFDKLAAAAVRRANAIAPSAPDVVQERAASPADRELHTPQKPLSLVSSNSADPADTQDVADLPKTHLAPQVKTIADFKGTIARIKGHLLT
jgi:hypothetical protein